MRKCVLVLMFIFLISSFACAASLDGKLVDVMKSANGLIPVIVEMNTGAKHVDVAVIGGKLKDSWTVINGFSADLPVSAINALAKNPNVKAISYDAVVTASLNSAIPAANVDDLWMQGYQGDGVTIAIVDTGIYPHQDFSGRIIAFKDYVNNRTATYDDNGHGTHCAGIAAGAGVTYRGAAYHAKLVGVKVLNSAGSGTISVIVNGINWVVANKAAYGIKVMAICWGGTITQSSTTDPVCSAVRSAWNSGIVVCVAAGNNGPNPYTIQTPGNEPLVITVAACDDAGVLAPSSSRGPTSYDGWNKPDCMLPGVDITACDNAVSGYVTMSGTSMATALAAGISAVYLEAHPTASPATVKSYIKATYPYHL